MLRLTAWVSSAVFALPLFAAVRQPEAPWWILAGLLGMLATSIAYPSIGLLIIVGLLPMGPPLGFVTGQPGLPEQLLLAFLVGTAWRLALDRRRAPSQLAAPALVFSLVIAGSILLKLSAQQLGSAELGPFLADLWRNVSRSYFTDPMPEGLREFYLWSEALAVAVTAERLLRRDPLIVSPAVRLLLIGGTGFAAFSANRLSEIALRSDTPVAAVLSVLTRLRFSPFIPDVNAAGSLYALFLAPAIWLAWRDRRVWAAIAVPLLALALWLAGSRAAVGGVAAALGLVWLIACRPGGRQAILAAILATVVVVTMTGTSVRNARLASAGNFRIGLSAAAVRLTATAPVFGVGLSRFRQLSPSVLPDEWKARFTWAAAGENVHNNFLQILAELGLVGLAAFLWLLTPAVGNMWRAAHARRSDPATFALASGLAAFLFSALLGQPLMLEHVQLTFLLVLGVATGISTDHPPAPARTWKTWAFAALLAGFVATVPWRVMDDRRNARLRGIVIGASEQNDVLDGTPYRVAARHSTWFLSSESRAVEIPLRLQHANDGDTCTVDIAFDDRKADIVSPPFTTWMRSEFQVPPQAETRRWRRLTLDVNPAECVLLVGALTERR